MSEGPNELSGALKNLVSQLAESNIECDHDVVSKNIHSFHGKGQGYHKRAMRWMLVAEKRGYDALILVIDEDGVQERIQQITKAQEDKRVTLPRALGVAIRTFDAWMLADEQALTKVLGRHVPRQPDPEHIKDPKSVCIDLQNTSNYDFPRSRMYSAITQVANVQTIQSRCPRGFAPFATRVRALQ